MNNSIPPENLNIAFVEEEENTLLRNPGRAMNLTENNTREMNVSAFGVQPEVPSIIAPVANNGPAGHFLNEEPLPNAIAPVANNGPAGHFMNDEPLPDAIESVGNNGPANHFLNNSVGHARKRKQRGGRTTYRKKRSTKGKSRRTHKRLSYRRRSRR